MDLANIIFTPLFPGEFPGDPELGGWRPLPNQLYKPKQRLALTLEEMVRLVAFRLHEFRLRQAVGIVAQRLAS